MKRPHLELRKGLIRWHVALVGANGETMMFSENYFSKSNAERAIRRLADALHLNWIEQATL